MPVNDSGEYAGAMARWLRDVLVPAIPRAATDELAVIAAMSGPPSGDGAVARRVTWEGQTYRLDLGAAERQRLQKVREKQESASLDVAIELGVAGRALAADTIALDDAQDAGDALDGARRRHPAARRARRRGHDAAGRVAARPTPPRRVRKVLDELTRHVRGKDLKRAARVAESLSQLADALLAQALASIAYAADVGDPDGTVLLADDVSRRHDFGFGAKDAEVRLRAAWAVPRPEVTPGVPWHVNGSLLGLDIALAPLALRRLNFERVLEAPKLTSNERDSFALSVSLLNPFDLRDADRDAIVEAVDAGPAARRRPDLARHAGVAGGPRGGVRPRRRRDLDGRVAAPGRCAGCSRTRRIGWRRMFSADRAPGARRRPPGRFRRLGDVDDDRPGVRVFALDAAGRAGRPC